MGGVLVGKVSSVGRDESGGVLIDMEMSEEDLEYVPANVVARVLPATVFGTTFVDLVVHGKPAEDNLEAGADVKADTTQGTLEFQQALDDIDRLVKALGPAELASAIGSAAQALQGRGDQLAATVNTLNCLPGAAQPADARGPRGPAGARDHDGRHRRHRAGPAGRDRGRTGLHQQPDPPGSRTHRTAGRWHRAGRPVHRVPVAQPAAPGPVDPRHGRLRRHPLRQPAGRHHRCDDRSTWRSATTCPTSSRRASSHSDALFATDLPPYYGGGDRPSYRTSFGSLVGGDQ